MTHSNLANRILVKLAAFIFAAAFTALPSQAQAQVQDFKIMISGPWQFVIAIDPNEGNVDRLFVIAPFDITHVANFWSGENASMKHWMDSMGRPDGEVILSPDDPNTSKPNEYSLDFYPTGTRLKAGIPDEEREQVYETTTHVLPSRIQSVLTAKGLPAGIHRYAISLPLPDAVNTYSGAYGLASTVAEAKIDKAAPTSATAPAEHSTWTVLHYGFQGALPGAMTFSIDGAATGSIDTSTKSDNYARDAISIGLVEAPLCNPQTTGSPTYYPTGCGSFPPEPTIPNDNKECDKLSGLSFALSAQLWGLNEFARFPVERDAQGNQEMGTYDYQKCTPYAGGNVDAVRAQEEVVARHNFAVADTSGPISDIRQDLAVASKVRLAKSGSRSNKSKQKANSRLPEDVVKIATDLEFLFPGRQTGSPDGVPLPVADAYYCLCTDVVSAADNTAGLCLKLTPNSAQKPACAAGAQDYLKTISESISLGPADYADKGSSDCHSPQISIDGAVQSQP